MTVGRALWLDALQRLADRLAHEIKNPLNGAVLNVEVVRQRAPRPGMEAAALAPFADAAATELARATEAVEALLALARSARAPVDLWMVAQPILAAYRVVAAAADGSLAVDRPAAESTVVAGEADEVRLALATALDAMVGDGAAVTGTVEACDGAVCVTLRSARGPRAIAAAARDAIATAGIVLEDAPGHITIRFATPASYVTQTT